MKKPFGRLLMNVWKSDFKEQPVLVHYLEYKEYYNAVCRGKEYRVPAFQVLLCSVQQGFCYGTEIYKLSNEVGGYSIATVVEQPVPPFAVPFYINPPIEYGKPPFGFKVEYNGYGKKVSHSYGLQSVAVEIYSLRVEVV